MFSYSRVVRSSLPALARSSGYALTNVTAAVARLQSTAASAANVEPVKKPVDGQYKKSRADYAKINAEKKEVLLNALTELNTEIAEQIKIGSSSKELMDLFFSKVAALPKVHHTSRLVKETLKVTINNIMKKATREANDINQQRVPVTPHSILNKAIYQEIADISNFSYVATILLKEGDFSGVMSLWVTYLESTVGSFVRHNDSSVITFHSLVTLAYLESCIASKSQPQLEKLEQLLQVKRLPKMSQLRSTLRSVVPPAHERSKPINDALDSLFLYSWDPNGTSNIVEALDAAERGDIKAVRNTWFNANKASQLNGKKISEDTLVAFMKMFNILNSPKDSQTIWNTIISSGVAPSTNAWNTLLVTVSKLGAFQKRLGQVEFIKSKIPSPNDETIITLIKIYTQLKQFAKIEELAEGKLNVPVVAQVYLQALLAQGDFSQADKFIAQAKASKIQLNQQSYNKILATVLKQGLYSKFPEYLEEMKSSGVKPDIATYTIMMDYDLKILANRGQMPTEHAFDVFFQDLADKDIAPNMYTFTTIMDNLAKNGSLETAQLLLRYLQNSKMASPVTYISLITSEFDNGAAREAEAHFNEFLAENFRVSASHWAALFKGLSRNGKIEKCKEYLAKLDATPNMLNKFSIYFLLTAARSKNDKELAQQVLEFIAKHRLESVLSDQSRDVIKDLESRQELEIPERIQSSLL